MTPGDSIRIFPDEQDRKYVTDSTSLLFHDGEEFVGTVKDVDDSLLVTAEAQFSVAGVKHTLEFRGLRPRTAENPEIFHAYAEIGKPVEVEELAAA
jgi:hypothetical protein